MANELDKAIRQLCLAFPQTEELLSHGMPNYRIRGGKVFVMYSINHHGDGRIALWLCTPAGMQDTYVGDDPKHFFVPPYVGSHGWLGVRLDLGLPWKRVAELVRIAYEHKAPRKLAESLGRTPSVAAPKKRVTAADVDPRNSPRGKAVLAVMRKVCLDLPETSEGVQFGQPVWKAGKKVFAQAYCYDTGWRATFWVGIPAQSLMIADPRFEIPRYIGHNGWISLDVSKRHSESELRSLAVNSYRHFALKRMLSRMGP